MKIGATRRDNGCYRVNLTDLESAMKIMGIEFNEIKSPAGEQPLFEHINQLNELKKKYPSSIQESLSVLLFKDEIEQLNKLWKNRKNG